MTPAPSAPGIEVVEALTERDLPRRNEDPVAVVLHTTGDTDLDEILRYYRSKGGLQPHYAIATDGTILHIAHESRVAYHCLITPTEAALYAQGFEAWSRCVWKDATGQALNLGAEQARYRMWRDEWRLERGRESPLELVTGRRPNLVSIGIELQASEKEPADGFTDAQYLALSRLLVDVGTRRHIPIDREHILGHADCSPMRRCDERGPWDPPRTFKWGRIWDLVRKAG